MTRYFRQLMFLTLQTALCSTPAFAHFPWLVRGDEGKIQYYFSDGISDLEYEMPEPISNSEILQIDAHGETTPIECEPINTDRFKGRKSIAAVARDASFVATSRFGLFRGGLLDYTAMHWSNPLPTERPSPSGITRSDATNRPLNVEIIDTDSGIDVYPLRDGRPIPNIKVTLYDDLGATLGHKETDENGKVTFENTVLTSGLMAIMFGSVTDSSGEINGQSYSKASHYLTCTFTAPPHQSTQTLPSLPELPTGLTSFGAAKTPDAIYVYGGNVGEAHDYYRGVQSDKLLKLDMRNPSQGWQPIANGEPIQGLGMAAYNNSLILVGGFTALNEPGGPQDLRSQSSVKQFDLESMTWKDLPPLPEARSSHDIAILGDKLYVVGGWTLQGTDGKSEWLNTAWVLNLAKADAKWEPIANPPFFKRALSVVAHKGKIFAIGGMQKEGGPTKSVWIYHPTENQWNEAGSLLGDKTMAGFGNAAWSISNNLIASTYEGDVEQFDEEEDRWKVIGKTASARFFHRLVPMDQETLISIGGANMGEGKFLELEPIPIKPR